MRLSSICLLLPSTSALLVLPSTPASLCAPCKRTRTLVAVQYDPRVPQEAAPTCGWVTGVDESGQAYYFREETGEFQWDPPPEVQQNYGTQVLWRVVGISGIRRRYALWDDVLQYHLRNGDVQVLSRFAMMEQKLTVSRNQCTVQVRDGIAILTSCGKSPTLFRPRDHPRWIVLDKGDQIPLNDGDLVSLDFQDADGAVFMCEQETSVQRDEYGFAQLDPQSVAQQQGEGSYAHQGEGSYAHQGEGSYAHQGQGSHALQGQSSHALQGQQSHLPYPWQQLFDPNSGAAYYSNPQTGESSWEPPLQEGFWSQ
eukprot:4534024-Prymnesium_polylepis.1